MINAASTPSTPTKSFSELVAELQKNDEPKFAAASQTSESNTPNSPIHPTKKGMNFSPRVVLGSLVTMLLLVGGAAGVYMVQRQGIGETRQQASVSTGKLAGIATYNNSNATVTVWNDSVTATPSKNFTYGNTNNQMIMVSGDWNGDGIKSIGLYDPATSQFLLRNTATNGQADLTFIFGSAPTADNVTKYYPVAGDWDGNGTDTIGLYEFSTGKFYLRNSNTAGNADITLTYGDNTHGPNQIRPIVGDWDGNGTTTIGIYDRVASSFLLRNSNTTGVPEVSFGFGTGNVGWIPVVGDWDGNGVAGVALLNPQTGTVYFRNSLTTGQADSSITIATTTYTTAANIVSGNWTGTTASPGVTPTPIAGMCSVSFTVAALPSPSPTPSPSPNDFACAKEVYQDEFSNSAANYTFTTRISTAEPGDVLVYKINLTSGAGSSGPLQISMSDVLSGVDLSKVTFMDSNCGSGAYNTTTKVLTCPAINVAAGQTQFRAFRVKLADNIITTGSVTITNTATATASGAVTPTHTCTVPLVITVPSPTPSMSPSPTPTPVCGETCTGTGQGTCQSGYTCMERSGSRKCELNACADGSRTCDSNRCIPIVVACGASCVSNSDCAGGHTCSGNKCLLQTCLSNPSTCETSQCRVTSCGSTCTSDSECASGHSCSNGICKQTICANGSVTCDSTGCQVVTQPSPSPTPTPSTGCNQVCTKNADCASPNHICVQTSDGNRCRLETNISSATCTTSVTSTPTQPAQPSSLPVAGTGENTLRFFLVGAGAMVIGIIGLLLL